MTVRRGETTAPAPPQPQAPTPGPVDRLTPGAGQEERGWLERSRLIPGNHESRSLMTQAFPELFPAPSLASCFSIPGPDGWRLIGIDTHDTDASESKKYHYFRCTRTVRAHQLHD